MRHMTSSSDRTRDARSEAERERDALGLVRTLRSQVRRRSQPLEVSLEHEEYVGRHVLSITKRDVDDVSEIPVYYEQLVFSRYRRTLRGDDVFTHP